MKSTHKKSRIARNEPGGTGPVNIRGSNIPLIGWLAGVFEFMAWYSSYTLRDQLT